MQIRESVLPERFSSTSKTRVYNSHWYLASTTRSNLMTTNRDIPWLRIFAEGTAIVVSILLAFAIDAWWENRREVAAEQLRMNALVEEFQAARAQLELQAGRLEGSLQGTKQILELTGNAQDATLEDVSAAIGASLNVGVFPPKNGVLQSVLSSRGGVNLYDADLWSQLQEWPILIRELELDSQHLEDNREHRFLDAILRLDIPLSVLLGGPRENSSLDDDFEIPDSGVDVDVSVLLQDPGIDTVFTMRALRTQMLIQSHNNALMVVDDIVAQLEQHAQ